MAISPAAWFQHWSMAWKAHSKQDVLEEFLTDKLVFVWKEICMLSQTHACNFVFTAHFEPSNSIFVLFKPLNLKNVF